MWRLAFVLLGIGFAWSSVSWFSAGRRSLARARFLERLGDETTQTRYWHAVGAKDNLIGGLFLVVAIAVAGVGVEKDVRLADYLLLVSAIPLVLSLGWIERFRWAATMSEEAAESAQQLREQSVQVVGIARHLGDRLGMAERTVHGDVVVESIYCPVEGAVGGDFVGCVTLPSGGVAIVLGDITGHGLSAALDAMRLKDLLLAELLRSGSPSAALAAGNAHLRRRGEVLATAFIGVVHQRGLRYASAGHLPGLVIEAEGRRELPSTGLLLGAVPDVDIAEDTVELAEADLLVVFTDGLLEAYGAGGGLDATEIASLVRRGDFSLLRERVHERGHLPLRDDIAAVLLRSA